MLNESASCSDDESLRHQAPPEECYVDLPNVPEQEEVLQPWRKPSEVAEDEDEEKEEGRVEGDLCMADAYECTVELESMVEALVVPAPPVIVIDDD